MKYVTILSDSPNFPIIIRAIDIEYGKRFNEYMFDAVENFGLYEKKIANKIYYNLLAEWNIIYNHTTQVIQISEYQLSFLILTFGTY